MAIHQSNRDRRLTVSVRQETLCRPMAQSTPSWLHQSMCSDQSLCQRVVWLRKASQLVLMPLGLQLQRSSRAARPVGFSLVSIGRNFHTTIGRSFQMRRPPMTEGALPCLAKRQALTASTGNSASSLATPRIPQVAVACLNSRPKLRFDCFKTHRANRRILARTKTGSPKEEVQGVNEIANPS